MSTIGSMTGRPIGMTDAEKKAALKAERMAAALRENLRRRKAQARAVGAAPATKDEPSS